MFDHFFYVIIPLIDLPEAQVKLTVINELYKSGWRSIKQEVINYDGEPNLLVILENPFKTVSVQDTLTSVRASYDPNAGLSVPFPK